MMNWPNSDLIWIEQTEQSEKVSINLENATS